MAGSPLKREKQKIFAELVKNPDAAAKLMQLAKDKSKTPLLNWCRQYGIPYNTVMLWAETQQ